MLHQPPVQGKGINLKMIQVKLPEGARVRAMRDASLLIDLWAETQDTSGI